MIMSKDVWDATVVVTFEKGDVCGRWWKDQREQESSNLPYKMAEDSNPMDPWGPTRLREDLPLGWKGRLSMS